MAKSKYMEDFPLLVEGMARDGLSVKQICHNFDISQETFYQYIKKYPEFSDSFARGKAPVDYEVENAMLKRILGYTVIEKTTKTGPMGIETVEKERHIPGDVTAQTFWLRCRRPKVWQDKKIITNETDKDAGLKNLLEEGE